MDGRMIAEKRKEMGLTQEALGARLGISVKAVSKWERGLSQPCEEHLTQLVDLLGLPREYLPREQESSAPTFLSTVRNEFVRLLATGVMIAVCVCNLGGMISTNSTVVSLGFSAALFCFGTMIRH